MHARPRGVFNTRLAKRPAMDVIKAVRRCRRFLKDRAPERDLKKGKGGLLAAHRLSINPLGASPRTGRRPAGLAWGRRGAAAPACPLLLCMAADRERPQAREAAMKSLAEMAQPFPRNPRKTWRSHFFDKLRAACWPPKCFLVNPPVFCAIVPYKLRALQGWPP